jgi:hypothetical protein
MDLSDTLMACTGTVNDMYWKIKMPVKPGNTRSSIFVPFLHDSGAMFIKVTSSFKMNRGELYHW